MITPRMVSLRITMVKATKTRVRELLWTKKPKDRVPNTSPREKTAVGVMTANPKRKIEEAVMCRINRVGASQARNTVAGIAIRYRKMKVRDKVRDRMDDDTSLLNSGQIARGARVLYSRPKMKLKNSARHLIANQEGTSLAKRRREAMIFLQKMTAKVNTIDVVENGAGVEREGRGTMKITRVSWTVHPMKKRSQHRENYLPMMKRTIKQQNECSIHSQWQSNNSSQWSQ
mmetsp:Transcript_42213/g.101982  ORF Transcript_42213/g.101982 Transcript_42213/m.101982 type:complete len:230 (+) Transcript_42213:569-1258(+)